MAGSGWRWLRRGLAGTLVLGLGVVLAWVVSNRVDASPVPPPAALVPPPPGPGSPLFFRLQGLGAPAGQSLEAAGRASWAALHAPARATSDAAPAEVAGPGGMPFTCRAPEDCPARLAEAAPGLRARLLDHAAWGARCTEAVADLRYEEPRPPRLTPETPLPSYQHALQCGHWFRGQALAAAAEGDPDEALRQLRLAGGLGRALFDHSPMLIGRMVGAAMVRGHDDALMAMARLQPGWSEVLAALAEPIPASALDPRPWLVMEAAWVRGVVDQVGDICPGADGAPEIEGLPGAVAGLACRWGLGFLPEATRQGLDALWLPQLQAAEGGLQPALQRALEAQGQPAPSPLAWRNPVGRMLLAVGVPQMGPYLARVADVDLHRRATALALTAAAVPVAERGAWLQARDLPAPLRARLAWVGDAAQLEVRPWSAEFPGTDPRRAPYTLTVPSLP